jgi:hypothetical protein
MGKTERMALVATKLGETSFYMMPASTKYHNNFSGGLAEHCTSVWKNLETLTTQLGLKWEDESSPFVIAMLHDACKIDAYFYNHDYGCWERNDDHPDGHGDLSLKIAERLGIELTEEEKACIRWHMGAFDDKENWSGYTDAIHQYPNVLWVHTADMMAAHIDEVRPERKVCCLCGETLPDGEYGNNPRPLKSEGVCCNYCNGTKVIPARIERLHRSKED